MSERESSVILITTPALNQAINVSGVATVVRGILDGCKGSRWHFRTVLIGKSDRRTRNLFWALAQVLVPFRFLAAIRSERPNIIHINGPLNTLAVVRDFVLLTIAKPFSARLVYHLHGGLYISQQPTSYFFRWMIKSLLQRPDAILVLGACEARKVVSLYGADPNRITILPNAVPISDIPEPPRDHSGRLRVLSLGRLSPEKGLEILCEAFERDARLRENIHLRMYGAGPLEDKLVPRFEAALGASFEFGGVIGATKRDEAFRWADVLIMPSLHGEGLPMVLLEAMSAGVVPIATADGMITDVLEDEKTGFLIAKSNSKAIADTLLVAKVARGQGKLKRMSRSGRALIAKRHSLRAYVNELVKLYEGLNDAQ